MDKSGTSLKNFKIPNPPDMLSYPVVEDISKVKEMDGQFVYVMKAYPLDGLGVTIHRRLVNGEPVVNMRFGDWDGNVIDLGKQSPQSNMIDEFINNYSSKFITVMRTIQLQQAQFYIVKDTQLRLVDLRISLNKMAGPGMLKEIFSKTIAIQEEIGKPTIFSEEIDREAILSGINNYNTNLILKPSRFKTIIRGNTEQPLYATITR